MLMESTQQTTPVPLYDFSETALGQWTGHYEGKRNSDVSTWYSLRYFAEHGTVTMMEFAVRTGGASSAFRVELKQGRQKIIPYTETNPLDIVVANPVRFVRPVNDSIALQLEEILMSMKQVQEATQFHASPA